MRAATYFHCQLKPISRGAGKSVVNCAAYRTGSRLEDKHYGQVRDYTHKKDVVTSFTVAPEGAPDWARDTGPLWNAVEKKENRKNSILSYEWEVALPNELDDANRENIARNVAGWLRDEYGVAVTVGIHNGGDRGNGKNDHAHIFMTTREITGDGWAKNKLRDFNVRPGQDNPEVDRVREQVATFINTTLADNGSDERVDARSYAERGIPIEGTKHLGPAACAIERQGIDTDRAAINREIIEARLAWQREQAQPEIDAAIAADLARRFGDAAPATGDAPQEIPPDRQEGPQGIPPDREEAPQGTPPDWVEAPQGTPPDWIEAPKGTPPDWEEATPSGPPKGEAAAQATPPDWKTADTGQGSDRRKEYTAWENLAGKVRSYWERLAQLVHDQGSGAPTPPQPEAETRGADSETNKSWVERVMDSDAVQAGRRLLHGWSYRDGVEFAEGIRDTAAIVEGIIARGPKQPAALSTPPAEAVPPDSTAQPAATTTHPAPGSHPSQGSQPSQGTSAFDRLSASMDASQLQPHPSQGPHPSHGPRGKPVSAFEALMAQRVTPPRPGADAPEQDGMTPEP